MEMTTENEEMTVIEWLRENVGRERIASLTHTDRYALLAAVRIVTLWLKNGNEDNAMAFAFVVCNMQQETRWMAFHAIAEAGDWSHRKELWTMARRCLAGLEKLRQDAGRTVNFAPGRYELRDVGRFPIARYSPEGQAWERDIRKRSVEDVARGGKGLLTVDSHEVGQLPWWMTETDDVAGDA